MTGIELLPVRATQRTVWLLVRLRTDAGLTGLGEASDAFGFANTTREDAARMETELRGLFELVSGALAARHRALPAAGAQLARRGLVQATAYSAIEQALWDLAGEALDVPVATLLGGRVRDRSRSTPTSIARRAPRTAAGFAAAAARAAAAEGFQARQGGALGRLSARRLAGRIVSRPRCRPASPRPARCATPVEPDVELMVDCHSFFDVALADPRRQGARAACGSPGTRSPWRRSSSTTRWRSGSAIRQPMAGGEVLFGVAGFAPLSRTRAVHVIMPDVKHCGGLLELTRIAAMADADGVAVAPHNPSGPVGTAATVQACAVLKNFRLLELQWGEAAWRGDLLSPPERFAGGAIEVPDRPGFGVELNDAVVRAHLM